VSVSWQGRTLPRCSTLTGWDGAGEKVAPSTRRAINDGVRSIEGNVAPDRNGLDCRLACCGACAAAANAGDRVPQ